MSAPVQHPSWCDRSRCTVDVDPVGGEHRSAIQPAPAGVGLRAQAHISKTQRTYDTRPFVTCEIDTALNGLCVFRLTSGEMRELAWFLASMAGRADYDGEPGADPSPDPGRWNLGNSGPGWPS